MTEFSSNPHDPSDLLNEFILSRQDAAPVADYAELQKAMRGELHVPRLVAEYVRTHGTPEVVRGEEEIIFRGRCGKQMITASLDRIGTEGESVAIMASRRTLPLMRYSSTHAVNLRTVDPTWDAAYIYRPHRLFYMPHQTSPEAVSFWTGLGEQFVYMSGSEVGEMTTTGQIARDAVASQREVCNGYLNTTVALIDLLLQAEKVQ